MVNKNKIFSDLSKLAVDTMSTFSGLKDEIETIVSLRVNKIINKMNLVKKDEFDVLKKQVDKLMAINEKVMKSSKKANNYRKKSARNAKIKKKITKKR